MQTLGSNGRFGNQIFQYAFMRFYSRKFGLQYQVPNWVGQKIFGRKDPLIDTDFPRLDVTSKAELERLQAGQSVFDVDFWGYFQEVEYFSHDKDFFHGLFQPNAELQHYLSQCWESLQNYDIIGLHLRYGDYGYGYFFETPISWVIKELERRWDEYAKPVLYLATDDPRVRRIMKRFSPVLCTDVFPDAAKRQYPEFYCDFWALSKISSLLIIANSSFSFAASMLNNNCKKMLRPSLSQNGFITFDPWQSPVLLTETTPWLSFMRKHLSFMRRYNKIRRCVLFNLGSKLGL